MRRTAVPTGSPKGERRQPAAEDRRECCTCSRRGSKCPCSRSLIHPARCVGAARHRRLPISDVGGAPATSAFPSLLVRDPEGLAQPRRGFLALRARRSVGVMSARAGVLPRRRRARHDRFTPDMRRSSRRGDRFARRSRLYSPTPARCDRRGDDRGFRDRRGAWCDGLGDDCGFRDRRADHADSSYACWSERHLQSPSVVAASSASIEAMIA